MNELFLGGCTFKAAQQARFPEVPPTPQSADWASRGDAARIDVHSLLQQPWNCLDDPFETLEAIAAEAPVITNANFSITVKGLLRKYDISVDILVKIASGYFPVAISNHWVAREKRGAQRRGFFTRNLGASDGWVGEYSVRHHPQDSYRLALAALGLRDAGVHVPFGGVIGQDRERCFVEDIDYCLGVLGRRVALVAPELNAIDSATRQNSPLTTASAKPPPEHPDHYPQQVPSSAASQESPASFPQPHWRPSAPGASKTAPTAATGSTANANSSPPTISPSSAPVTRRRTCATAASSPLRHLLMTRRTPAQQH